MEGGRRYGRPNEELFMRQPSGEPNTPTVGPLRINKTNPQASPTQAQAALAPESAKPDSATSNYSPLYPNPYSQQSTSAATASALPYPDDRPEASVSPPLSLRFSPPPKSSEHIATPPQTQTPTMAAGNSPSADPSSKETLFQKVPPRLDPVPHASAGGQTWDADQEPPSAVARQFYAPFTTTASADTTPASLRIPNAQGVNRLASTASVSTTRGSRGSPPPPETPADAPPGGIEARYAAAGIAGPSTLSSLQAHNLASAQRQQQEQAASNGTPGATRPDGEGRRPWTPTEEPGTEPHGPALTYQGTSSTPTQTSAAGFQAPRRQNTLEQDMQGLQISEEPPPAYSSLSQPTQGYPRDKQTSSAAAAAGSAGAPPATTTPEPPKAPDASSAGPGHPAFANEGFQPSSSNDPRVSSPTPSRTSPPPLPEGWIAHLDQSSGQYYYIHLPTQSTQWEFPKGPTPLNLNNQPPLSPTGTFVNPLSSPTASTYGALPMSPGFPNQQVPQRESTLSMATLGSPTAAGFPQMPPAAGVEQYKVAPTNGVYFGPYLRYTNMDVDNGAWFGSIMLVTDAAHPPTIHIHQSVDLSPNPRQLKANHIYQHQRWMFYRYDVDLKMEDHEAKWTYAITSHLGCTRYEFLVAGRSDTHWRFIAHSGNDFALNVNANERTKVGGVGYMWKDILQKHQEVGGFHAQLGMGNQIYADRLWKEIPVLKQWTATSGKDNRRNAPWTEQHDSDVSHAYFHYYTSHLDQPHLREAFAQIPHVLTIDDHDIFDGYGSYPEYMQSSNMFKNIGRIGVEMYLLFQHHTTREILRNVQNDLDLFTITGTGWHFVKYLGPAVVIVGPDCRSERTPTQVMAGPTYQGLFPKVAMLPPSVQHCIWMIPVPLVYPRLETAEQFAQTMQTGKKAVNTTFNVLGKVTSSVAGVVGAKGVVGEGFNSVKKAVGKSGLMSNVLSPFGEIDIMDELRDQWTHESKDLERTYLIRTLQGIALNKSLRMTFFSGDVNCCGAGLVHDPSRPGDHKTMYQIISSSVVNAPPSPYVLRMLHPNSTSARALFIPKNGHRSTPNAPSDTKEDMLEVFAQDVNGQAREMRRLMGRRNYAAVVVFDPQVLQGAFGQHPDGKGDAGLVGSRLSLAIDWMVQGDGGYGGPATVKYGPLTINAVEYGK